MDASIIKDKLGIANSDSINTYDNKKFDNLIQSIPMTGVDPLGVLRRQMKNWTGYNIFQECLHYKSDFNGSNKRNSEWVI